jgi:lysophospholipase L1-like esterase
MGWFGRGMLSRARVGAAFALVVAGGLASSGPTAIADRSRPALALGDSVAFGYITQAGYQYVNPSNFTGFPERVGQELRFEVSNASCPGATSGSLLSSAAADNGCQSYRAKAPLHVSYGGSQVEYATAFVRQHPDTRLATVMVGANDLFLLQAACLGSPACINSGLPATLAQVGLNLDATYIALREAGFHGVLVAVTYFSVNYADPVTTGVIQSLDAVIAEHTLAAGGVVADGFAAFKAVATQPLAAGDSCKAGLLNATPDPARQFTCDIHPSQSGQALLARAVANAYLGARQEVDDSN